MSVFALYLARLTLCDLGLTQTKERWVNSWVVNQKKKTQFFDHTVGQILKITGIKL